MKRLDLFIIFCFLLYNYGGKTAQALLNGQTDALEPSSESQIGDPEIPVGNQINDLLTIFQSQLDNGEEPSEMLYDQFINLFSSFIDDIAASAGSDMEDSDTYKNVSEFITSEGYPLEEHTVITEDGYVLSMQRIPHGKNNNTQDGCKEVVLLLHGELGDGKTWFLNTPDQSLGYILPDAGYDVWILNNRGSTYSKKNIYYPTRSFQFWNFTFDEMGRIDTPAAIDYILNKTCKDALHIIGYSRGNTVGFVLLSERPEYNKKVKLLVALAPIAFVGYFTTVVRYFIPFRKAIAAFVYATTQGEFLPTNKAIRILVKQFCARQKFDICENLLYAVGGEDRAHTNETRIPFFLSNYLSSTSTKILLLFAQEHLSKRFGKFDYGLILNRKVYGQRDPPNYQLSKITAPVALFQSDKDIIADPTDVGILRSRLTSSNVIDYQVPGHNHFGFVFATDARKMVYDPLLGCLEQHSK